MVAEGQEIFGLGGDFDFPEDYGDELNPTAEDIPFTPAGSISATNVQDAIEEVAAEAGSSSGHVIAEAGTPVTDRATLNFLDGFDLTDDGGNDETEVALDLLEVSAFTDHSARHEDGGADEIDITGLSGTPAALTTHAAAADPHTGYVLESLFDAAGDFLRGSADNTPARQAASAATPAAVGTAGATGTATNPPSADDHVHAHELAHLAHDTLWAAAGDLVVGSGNDTAAILSAGTALSTELANLGSGVLAWSPRAVYAAADDGPITSDITLNNDAALSWAIGANEVWWFQAYIIFNAANTTMDVKVGWSVPASATMLWGSLAHGGANAGFHGVGVGSTGATILTAASTQATGTGTGVDTGSSYGGLVFNSTNAGTVNFQWSQATSDANNLTRKAGSLILIRRMV